MSKRKLHPRSEQCKLRVKDIKSKVQKGMTLRQIAKELGVSRQRVSQLLCRSLKNGEESIAQERRRHKGLWTEGQLALLGVLSDREMAERNGISVSMVCYKRRSLNIPPAPHQRKYGPRKSLVGRKFRRLKVLRWSRCENGAIGWICQCKCGNITAPIKTYNLLRKLTKSCGCRKIEMFKVGTRKWDKRTP